ncbi:IS3 family transposase%2C orfA [Yersinia thracica]|uniref:IS3 family transposase, orfA n=1 Tax=Yersinia thracica TaxID=2890319 RepID=A0A0T9PLE9_9GAMM|nr:integrase core domain-containing protein [Yersinia thracica]CNH71071.1 IS3 family transposase%2C orfA [Yersinia thracica]
MNQYVKRTQRDYPLSFKLAVVQQVEKGEMTSRQAQDRYGIQGSSTVQARKMVRESVETYNTRRPHLSLKYKTPDEVHQAF